jgi:hypothetical protein
MAAVVGERDLSWCGFATWASKTAGAFIRREELGPLVERWLDGALRRAGRLRTLIARGLGIHRPAPAGRLPAHDAASPSSFSLRTFAQAAIAQVGDAIAAGNQDVFGHIAPPFARLLTLWAKQGPKVPNAERGAFLDALGALGDGGQGEYLQQAFAATFEAAATPDPRRRAQLMLQANALIGCAEQTRVQPFIVTSMNAPLEDLFNQQLDAHLRARVPAPIARLLHWILRPIGRALEREFQDLSAEWMMRLQLPGESLRLGLDVPPLPDGRMYPEPLDALDAPSPRDLLAQLGALEAAGSAARDWATYGDRMRYLGVLFRSRQQQRVLWDAPFTESQLAALTKGRVPEGPL